MDIEFEDRPYDVVFEGTCPAGQILVQQAVQLRNVDAPWFLTGVTIFYLGGVPAITLRDYLGRALSSEPMAIESFGSFVQQSLTGSTTYMKWPQNSTMLLDLAELGAAEESDVSILFRGFKRYRKGEAPCQ